MLIQANLLDCLWSYALRHAIYIRNRIKHSTTGTTPYYLFTGERPDLKYVRAFGCAAYILRLPQASKFEPRALEGVYLETLPPEIYSILVKQEHGVYCIVESRHVTFGEKKFIGAPDLEEILHEEVYDDDTESYSLDSLSSSDEEASFDDSSILSRDKTYQDEYFKDDIKSIDYPDSSSNNTITPDECNDNSNENDNPENDIGSYDAEDDGNNNCHDRSHRYPHRDRKPPSLRYIASELREDFKIATSDDPTLTEIKRSTPEERNRWRASIDEEFQAFEEMDTWEPDDHPESQPLPTHMVQKIKRNSDGFVDRFRSRPVADGNYQVYGENYLETYAPVISFDMVRIFLYIALLWRVSQAQLDVNTAFSSGLLAEAIWVMSPKGIARYPSRCLPLKRAIYGLMQAHLAWHKRFCEDMRGLGFEELSSAPCIFAHQDCPFG